jgi:hypothetical protein
MPITTREQNFFNSGGITPQVAAHPDSLGNGISNTLQGAMSMPVMPTMNHMPGGSQHPDQHAFSNADLAAISAENEKMNTIAAGRPSSTVIMQAGEKETRK